MAPPTDRMATVLVLTAALHLAALCLAPSAADAFHFDENTNTIFPSSSEGVPRAGHGQRGKGGINTFYQTGVRAPCNLRPASSCSANEPIPVIVRGLRRTLLHLVRPPFPVPSLLSPHSPAGGGGGEHVLLLKQRLVLQMRGSVRFQCSQQGNVKLLVEQAASVNRLHSDRR